MKKQHKTYILIAAVVIVWGVIGFQFFNYLTPNEEKSSRTVSKQNIVRKKVKKKENYVVKRHARDPFLGKLLTTPIKKTKRKKVAEPVSFPSIIYHGIIESSKKRSFIISINGNQSILKAGQVINDIKLLSGSKKEIKISYKGNNKVIPLN